MAAMGEVYRVKSKGPRTEPLRAPKGRSESDEQALPILTKTKLTTVCKVGIEP